MYVITITVYRQSSRSSTSVKLSRVVLWDMEQQYQDTMTLTWLSTLEVGSIYICPENDNTMSDSIHSNVNSVLYVSPACAC